MQEGDDLRWAQPTWDDRAWPLVMVPHEKRQRKKPKRTIVWYRRAILMPKGFRADQAPALGIALGEIRSAYEVYANGQKIGQVGQVAPHPKGSTARHAFHLVPTKAFQGERLVIALRVWQPKWLLRHYGGKPRLGPSFYSFGLYKLLKERIQVLRQRQREEIILLLFVASLLLLVALYHFHLYRGRSELSAYFWYGLLLICLAGWVAGKPIMKFFLLYNDTWGWILTRSTALLAFFPAIEFAYRALDQKRPPKAWQICQWISFAGFLACLLLGPRLAPLLPNTLLSLFFSGMLLGLLIYTIRRAWQGHPDARTIQGGMIVAFVLLMWKYAISAKLLPYVSLPLATMAFCILVLSLAFALSNQYRRTLSDLKSRNRQLNEMNNAIQRFVPVEFLAHLGREDLRQVQRGDQNQLEMTTFFSDVRSFTSLVESMTPAETMLFVNRYLNAMEPPISKHNGFIDKYIGDAVMALFDEPDDALQASIDCLKALEDYNQQRIAEGEMPVKIGIGLHTGTLMLGTVGGEHRLSCTVLGDSVNLASRIEGLTKLYSAPLLITGQTRDRLKDPSKYKMQQVDRVAAKGKTEPVDLYEVWDGLSHQEQQDKQATHQAFQKGYQAFVVGDFQDAQQRFLQILQDCPQDRLVQLYVERCQHFIEQGIPEHWNGIVRMHQK
ncbi:MAG: adenylate/guanylate cyclase domain-containing protein [Myxococcales bacterium]|nr:adenylate/guanylate cyclase domain-containing protein [Myxococcales bacterium]